MPPFATWPTPSTIQAAADGYRIWLAPVNLPSDDGRVIVDSLGHRAGRLPLMFSDSEMGHGDAIHVGTFTNVHIVEVDGVQWAVSDDVEWDSDAEAVAARRMVDDGQFRGVSIHMGRGRFAEVCPNGSGGYTEVDAEDIDVIVDEETGIPLEFRAPCDEPLWGAFEATIAAATIVAIPAFETARIEPEAATIVASVEEMEGEPGEAILVGELGEGFEPILRAAGGVSLDAPPVAWFANPEFGDTGTGDDADPRLVYDDRHDQWGCPLTVTSDGQVFGHLALWRTCHTGYRDRCVTAPRGADLTPFHQCRVTTDDGETLAVGPLVVDEGHAPVQWTTDRVSRHYADTTLAAAYVTVGEDRHGIWVAGAVSPRATSEMVDTLRRHSLSGDWRSRDGRMELIAAVSVNSPGFPVPQVLVASGEPVGMITFGAPQPDTEPTESELVVMALEAMSHRIDRLTFLLTDVEADPAVAVVDEPCDECGEADPAVTSVDDQAVEFLADELLDTL